MVNITQSPTITCGFLSAPVGVVATYKGKTNFIIGARVRYQYGFMFNQYINTNNIGLAQTCISSNFAVGAFISKQDIDFGSGIGKEHFIGEVNAVNRAGKPYMFGVVEARTTFRALPSIQPPTLLPTPPPPTAICSQIGTKVESISIPNNIPSSPTIPFYIYLRGIKEFCKTDPTNPSFIKNITDEKGTVSIGRISGQFDIKNGIADFDLSKIINMQSVLNLKIPAEVLTITIKDFSTTKTVNLPYTPTIPTCGQTGTGVSSVNIPSSLSPAPTSPFYIRLSGIQEYCKTDPTFPPSNITNEKGTVILGSYTAQFDIKNGIADFDLSKLIDLSKIIKAETISAPAPPPPPAPAPTKPSRCVKTGRLSGVGLSSVQSYLNECYPGARAAAGTGTWTGAYKITRGAGGNYPANTYFWAIKWEDIKRFY